MSGIRIPALKILGSNFCICIKFFYFKVLLVFLRFWVRIPGGYSKKILNYFFILNTNYIFPSAIVSMSGIRTPDLNFCIFIKFFYFKVLLLFFKVLGSNPRWVFEKKFKLFFYFEILHVFYGPV